jgi:DNA-binding CsgD family transcriptional regulator/catechol 2,3-dioxygenase-like lactoylglutathione lyase family enzyme
MVAHPFGRTGRPRHADVLTPAEWDVLAGVRDGASNREIAERRGCDLETVRFHLRNLRRKLDVQTRDGLRAFPGRPAGEIERRRATLRGRRIREQIPLIQTADMRRALEFYVGALGLDVVARWPDDGSVPRWVALAAGGARLMLRVGHPRRTVEHRQQPGTVALNFYVEGLDEVRRELVAAGHACGRPAALFYGAREFYLLDPDGNELAIVEFAASDPGYMATARRRRGGKRSGRRA